MRAAEPALSRRVLCMVLLLREAGPRPVLEVAAIAALGAAAGLMVGRMRLTEAGAIDLPGSPGEFLASLNGYAVGVVALLGLLRVVSRIPEDRAAGWTVPYIAAGGSRMAIAFATCASVMVAMYAALLAWGAAFGGAHLVAGGGPGPLLELPRNILRSIPLVVAMSAFGLFVSLLARSVASALFLLIASVAVPTYVVLSYAGRHERWPAELARYAFIHLPPMPRDEIGSMLLEYVAYVVTVAALAAVLAARRIGRCA